ncbi:MAG: hypothetical protein R6V04_12235 [bacterium]
MKMNGLNAKIFLVIISGLILVGNGIAQNSKKDTVSSATKELNQNPSDTVSNELILDEISIKGEIDRPNVTIMPKRVETDVKKIDLERKFSEEVNKAQGEVPELKEELRKIENIESIKNTMKKDRLKKNNTKGKKKKEK